MYINIVNKKNEFQYEVYILNTRYLIKYFILFILLIIIIKK